MRRTQCCMYHACTPHKRDDPFQSLFFLHTWQPYLGMYSRFGTEPHQTNDIFVDMMQSSYKNCLMILALGLPTVGPRELLSHVRPQTRPLPSSK